MCYSIQVRICMLRFSILLTRGKSTYWIFWRVITWMTYRWKRLPTIPGAVCPRSSGISKSAARSPHANGWFIAVSKPLMSWYGRANARCRKSVLRLDSRISHTSRRFIKKDTVFLRKGIYSMKRVSHRLRDFLFLNLAAKHFEPYNKIVVWHSHYLCIRNIKTWKVWRIFLKKTCRWNGFAQWAGLRGID